MTHPRDILLGAQARTGTLPVCDHYSGVEARMRKSLQPQEEMTQEFGACVFDVTLDCEDGAPVGGEADHAALVVSLALSAKPDARVAVRVHPVDHPAFESDIATIAGQAGHRLVHIMLPKVERFEDVERAAGRGPQLGKRLWWPLRKKWAITLIGEGFYDVGLELLLAARADEPDDAELYYWLGYASLHKRQVEARGQ